MLQSKTLLWGGGGRCQIKKNMMDGECGIYGGKEKCGQNFGGKNWKKKHLVDLGVNDSVILKYMDRMVSNEFVLFWIEESGMLLVKETLYF